MRVDVVTVTPETSMQDVVDLLNEHQVSGLPVVGGEGRLLGVVTEYDVLRAISAHQLDQQTATDGRGLSSEAFRNQLCESLA